MAHHPNQTSIHPSPVPPQPVFTTAIRLVIRALIAQGTRHGVELKASDTLLANSQAHLKDDPTNRTLQADHAVKEKKRDACLNQIDALASHLTSQLQIAIRQCSTHAPSSAPVGLEQLRALEKQFTRIEQELEHTHRHQQESINDLRQQVHTQNVEIAALKQLLEQVRSTDTQKLESASLVPQEVVSSSATEADQSGRPLIVDGQLLQQKYLAHEAEIFENKRNLCELADSVAELHANVIATLTREIPNNLQRSVRMMQEDVNSAVHTAIVSCHEQLADLVRDFAGRYDSRISSLERLGALQNGASDLLQARRSQKATLSKNNLSGSSQEPTHPNNTLLSASSQLKLSEEPTLSQGDVVTSSQAGSSKEPSLPKAPSPKPQVKSKDPRVRRRQSGISTGTTSDDNLKRSESGSECRQQ